MLRLRERKKRLNLPTRQKTNRKERKSAKARPPTIAGRLVTFLSILLLLFVLILLFIRHSTEIWIHGSIKKADVGWNDPLIHIVHTRFMQDQPSLRALGWARLELFTTICLPSMVRQTVQKDQKFLWIIQTDPKLYKPIHKALVDAIRPHENFYLVGSNRNFGFALNGGGNTTNATGSWKDGQEAKDLFRAPIYTGRVQNLRQAYLARLDVPVLETRLDADDALHSRYLEMMQRVALDKLGRLDGLRWTHLCTRKHMEWYATPTNDLNPMEHSHFCITAGLTVVYAKPTLLVPEYPHDVLAKKLELPELHDSCGVAHECVHLIPSQSTVQAMGLTEDEFYLFFGALRSRSLTSAGMLRTSLQNKPGKVERTALWHLAPRLFGINQESVEALQQYLQTHQFDIARDNLAGQCTKGHSCKLSSKDALQRIVDIEKEGKTGMDVKSIE